MQKSSERDKAPYFREIGNGLFKECKYAAARDAYDEAIKLDPKNGLLYCNRSMASLRLEEYGQAILDANQSVVLNCPKGLYRRACALMALGRFSVATRDLKSVLILFYIFNNKTWFFCLKS